MNLLTFTSKAALPLFFFLGILFSGCETTPTQIVDACEFSRDLSDYELFWEEEFDGSALDTTRWNYQIGTGCPELCGWGNNERQYYSDRTKNVQVRNGLLTIRAFEESFMGSDYTSGRINTKNKFDFKFGRVDVRAKLGKGQGIWPAVWMLPTDNVYGGWPQSGEIDIIETVGNEPEIAHGTVHYGQPFPLNRQTGFSYTLEQGDFSDDFHVFSVIWLEDCIQWMVDDTLYGGPVSRTTTLPDGYPFNEQFHLLVNMAVGGNWPGDPDNTTPFPQVLEVDYIKVYKPKE